jgi:hypothetical protein
MLRKKKKMSLPSRFNVLQKDRFLPQQCRIPMSPFEVNNGKMSQMSPTELLPTLLLVSCCLLLGSSFANVYVKVPSFKNREHLQLFYFLSKLHCSQRMWPIYEMDSLLELISQPTTWSIFKNASYI